MRGIIPVGLRLRVLAIVAVTVLPALALLLYSSAEQRSIATARVQQDALTQAEGIAAQHRQLIEGARQLLTALAELPVVRERTSAGCSALFAEIRQRFPLYANIGVADATGDVFCTAVPATGRVTAQDRAYFQRALTSRTFAIGDYQIGRLTGKPSLNLGYPVVTRSGVVEAVVFVAIDLAWLERYAAELTLPFQADVTLWDERGTVLGRHPDDGVAYKGQSFSSVPIVRAMLERGQGVTEAPGLDGTVRVVAFASLMADETRRCPCVAITIPKTVALVEVERTLAFHLTGLGFLALVAGAIAWVGTDVAVLRPVKTLLAATRRLGRGDLAARVGPPYGHGELAELTRAFDDAAGAIEDLTRRTTLILESVGEGICGLDDKGRITFVNPLTVSLTGYRTEELIGQAMHATLHHSRSDGTPSPVEQCPTAETLRHGTTRPVHDDVFWRKDGTSFAVDYVSAPLRDGTRVIGAVVAFRDVTERRRIEAELERQREMVHQSEKIATMGSLLAGVAHELNNPLAILMGQATLLKQTVPPGPIADRGEKILVAGQRCARIVRNFLALARKRAPERRAVDLNSVVKEAVEFLAYELRTESVEVVLGLAEDLPTVWADGHRLHQVIMNLMVNAAHAMRHAGGRRRLTIATRRRDGEARVQLEVADTGPGIPAEIQSQIFEPFFTTKPAGEGTGLGLSLCRGIIEEHDGTLSVASRPGQGATFRIELPIGTRSSDGPEGDAADSLPTVAPATVLVIDDEPEIAGLLAEILTRDGHHVTTAPNGLIALKMIEQRTYDLVICDTKMPGLDGIGFFEQAERSLGNLQHRMIFLTGDTLTTSKLAFLEARRLPFLPKPFEVADVQRLVRRVLAEASVLGPPRRTHVG